MRLSELANALYDAKQDGTPTKVLIQKVKTLTKDIEKYWLRIGSTKHAISKKTAINAIAWNIQIEYLPTKYQAKF